MPLSAEDRRVRARAAAATRWNPDRPELYVEDRRRLRAAAAARYITELVDGFPPLTQAQRSRLAVLLLEGGAGDDGPPR